jgi:4-carboxymuconolactone decarboxylase
MAAKQPPSTIAQVKDVFTKLGEISDKVVFGDVWERKQLSKRDRSLITVAALTALYRPDQLRGHLHRAFDNGVTKEEIIELITHLSFYAGWPNGGTAALIAKEVFKERGV